MLNQRTPSDINIIKSINTEEQKYSQRYGLSKYKKSKNQNATRSLHTIQPHHSIQFARQFKEEQTGRTITHEGKRGQYLLKNQKLNLGSRPLQSVQDLQKDRYQMMSLNLRHLSEERQSGKHDKFQMLSRLLHSKRNQSCKSKLFRSKKQIEPSDQKYQSSKNEVSCSKLTTMVIKRGLRLGNESKLLLIRKGKTKSTCHPQQLKSTIICSSSPFDTLPSDPISHKRDKQRVKETKSRRKLYFHDGPQELNQTRQMSSIQYSKIQKMQQSSFISATDKQILREELNLQNGQKQNKQQINRCIKKDRKQSGQNKLFRRKIKECRQLFPYDFFSK